MAKHPATTTPIPGILGRYLEPGENILWSGISRPGRLIIATAPYNDHFY